MISKYIEEYIKSNTGLTSVFQNRIYEDLPDEQGGYPYLLYMIRDGINIGTNRTTLQPNMYEVYVDFTIVSKTRVERESHRKLFWKEYLKFNYRDTDVRIENAGVEEFANIPIENVNDPRVVMMTFLHKVLLKNLYI